MTGKPEFTDGYQSPNADPTDDSQHAGGAYEFDWRELSLALREGGEMPESDYLKLVKALRAIFRFILSAERGTKGEKLGKLASRRLLALLWVIDPAFFSDSPSLSALAARVGVHKMSLSKHAAQVGKTFGVKNRFQHAHDWRKGKTKKP